MKGVGQRLLPLGTALVHLDGAQLEIASFLAMTRSKAFHVVEGVGGFDDGCRAGDGPGLLVED